MRGSGWAIAAAGVVAALTLGAAGDPERGSGARSDAPDTIAFTRDVAPIMYRECAVCHRPGGSAPLSLLTYEEAAPQAALIAAAVTSRRMPPWLPASGYVAFAGERRLSDGEMDVIRRWVEQGAPRGDPADLPPPPVWPDGWQLGEPDLVVEFPAYDVPAAGPERFRNLVASSGVTARRWVRAVELRPGSPRVVHHARLMVDTTASSRDADAQDPGPGFDGMELGSDAGSPPGAFVGWTPGKVPSPYPEGLAWPLAPGADLVLQLHLRPTGAAETVRPQLGLHFAAGPPRRPPALIMLGTTLIDIPAGDSAHVVTDRYQLPVDVEALGVYPHAHYLARRMEAFATLPNGERRWLLVIPEWDFNWQDEYRYAEPIRLPRGSVLTMHYTYDNSAANPRHPNRPPARVTYGPHSTDEMADLIVQVVVRRPADVAALERDLAWKYYTDAVTADAYRAYVRGRENAVAGRLTEAARAFRESLGQKFDDPVVHVALADALLALGEDEAALAHLEQAAAHAARQGDDALARQIRQRLAQRPEFSRERRKP